MHKLLAQAGTPLGTIGGAGLGPFGNSNFSSGTAAMTAITRVISGVIGIMTVVGSIWFFFNFLVGGLNWISAGGDKNKINDARDRMTYAFIGLLVVVAGISILAVAGMFLGWDILNPQNMIDQVRFGN